MEAGGRQCQWEMEREARGPKGWYPSASSVVVTVVQVQKGRLANNENVSSFFFGRRTNDELVNLVPGVGCWTNVFGAEGLGLETDCDPVVRGEEILCSRPKASYHGRYPLQTLHALKARCECLNASVLGVGLSGKLSPGARPRPRDVAQLHLWVRAMVCPSMYPDKSCPALAPAPDSAFFDGLAEGIRSLELLELSLC